MTHFLSCLAILFTAVLISAQQLPKRFKLPDIHSEASGLFIEAPDKLWWHNESGGEPTLCLTDCHGQLLDSLRTEGAVHRDWEDVTLDPMGTGTSAILATTATTDKTSPSTSGTQPAESPNPSVSPTSI